MKKTTKKVKEHTLKFPGSIFVYICNPGTEDEFLAVETNIESLEDGEVAVYGLNSIRTKKTEHKVV